MGECVATLRFAHPATASSAKNIVSMGRAQANRSLHRPCMNCGGTFSGRPAGFTQFPDSQLFSHFGII